MAHYVALSKEVHADRSLLGLEDLKAYVNQPTLPVYGAELPRLALNYPLAFIQQGEKYGLHLLCSFSNELPSAWITPQGKWLGGYIPAIIRQKPFTILPNEEGKRIVCVDEDSPRLGDAGSPLFEDGESTEFLKKTVDFLEQLYLNGVATQKATDLIASFDLMVPWELKVRKSEDQEATSIQGIYRVDEAKLNALDDEQWLTLRKVGAMALIYGQLLSMGHLGKLVQILKQKVDLLSKNAVAAENLDAFFGEEDDGALNFDGI
jgi:hypothetical protein